jgi:hypothetical protein
LNYKISKSTSSFLDKFSLMTFLANKMLILPILDYEGYPAAAARQKAQGKTNKPNK